MANRDQPTPRLPFEGNGDDDSAAADADLPLTSIPSVPEVPEEPAATTERRGNSSYVVGGAALFVLIVAVSLLGARYLKMPKSGVAIAPVEERPLAVAAPEQPAELTEKTAEKPVAAPVLQQAPPVSPPAPATAAAAAPAATARALAEAERAIEREREARRAAERRADELARAARSAPARTPAATKTDRKAKARITELEGQVTRLKKDLAARDRAATAAREQAAAHDSEKAATQSRLETAERRAREAEKQLADSRQSHESTLKGESEAVRKLVVDLNAARDEAAREKSARAEAEKKARSLESEVSRLRASGAGSASTAPAQRGPATATATAPARAEVREPERIKTVPPRYPDDLRRAGVSGRVTLKVLVGEQGTVEDVKVTSSPDPRLAGVATEAARRWQYTPGRKDGIRTRMWITEAVDFKL